MRGNYKNSTLLCFFCLFIAVIFDSRAFTLGYSAALMFIFVAVRRNGNLKIQLILGSLFLGLLTCLMIFCYKTDSSSGRLLIYKICYTILKDHIWAGIGIGKFKTTFCYYQASYFQTFNYSNKELLLADNTKHAFNDYLQFVIETGSVGVIILIITFVIITYLVIYCTRLNAKLSTAIVFSITQVVGVSIAAFFTHVFDNPLFQFLFCSTVFNLVCFRFYVKNKKIIYSILAVFCAVLFTANWGKYLIHYSEYKIYNKSQKLYETGNFYGCYYNLRSIFPALKTDILYLNLYADVLKSLGKSDQELSVLKQIVTIDNSFFFFEMMGDVFNLKGNLQSAENAYLLSINMVPNRFVCRYKLFNFYIVTKQYKKAEKAGLDILNLPVKIPSFQIKYIQEKVASILLEHKNDRVLH